jgi:hypothetical protein
MKHFRDLHRQAKGANDSPPFSRQTLTDSQFVELPACCGRSRFCRHFSGFAAYLFFRPEPILDILSVLPPALNINLIRSASDSIFYFLTFQHWYLLSCGNLGTGPSQHDLQLTCRFLRR